MALIDAVEESKQYGTGTYGTVLGLFYANFCIGLNLDPDLLFSKNPESGLASLNPDLYSIKRVRIRTETPKTDSDMSQAKDFVAINAFKGRDQ